MLDQKRLRLPNLWEHAMYSLTRARRSQPKIFSRKSMVERVRMRLSFYLKSKRLLIRLLVCLELVGRCVSSHFLSRDSISHVLMLSFEILRLLVLLSSYEINGRWAYWTA